MNEAELLAYVISLIGLACIVTPILLFGITILSDWKNIKDAFRVPPKG